MSRTLDELCKRNEERNEHNSQKQNKSWNCKQIQLFVYNSTYDGVSIAIGPILSSHKLTDLEIRGSIALREYDDPEWEVLEK